MNIDIINRHTSHKLGIKEAKVQQVNSFYWRSVKDHLHSHDSRPVNIEYVCVLFPSQSSVKKAILFYLKRIRRLQVSKRYKPDSVKRAAIIEKYKHQLRGFLKIRKQNGYTN